MSSSGGAAYLMNNDVGSRAVGINSLVVAGTTGAPIQQPNLASATAVTTSSVAQTFGSWAQVVAANAGVIGSHMLIGLLPDTSVVGSQATNQWQIEIGTGASGSEAAIGDFGFILTQNTLAGFNTDFPMWLPQPLNVGSSVRVAARAANGAGAATIIGIKLYFIPRPL